MHCGKFSFYSLFGNIILIVFSFSFLCQLPQVYMITISVLRINILCILSIRLPEHGTREMSKYCRYSLVTSKSERYNRQVPAEVFVCTCCTNGFNIPMQFNSKLFIHERTHYRNNHVSCSLARGYNYSLRCYFNKPFAFDLIP